MSVSAKGKQQKLVSTVTESGTVYISYYLLMIVACAFFPKTFLEIAAYIYWLIQTG